MSRFSDLLERMRRGDVEAFEEYQRSRCGVCGRKHEPEGICGPCRAWSIGTLYELLMSHAIKEFVRVVVAKYKRGESMN